MNQRVGLRVYLGLPSREEIEGEIYRKTSKRL